MRSLVDDRSDLCVRHTEGIVELRQLNRDLELRNVLMSAEVHELRRERDDLRQELDRAAADLAAMEAQHAALTNLYVAAHQLHGTMDRETVLSRIEEIIVNFVGSEEFGVYERTGADELRRIAQVGLRDDVDLPALQDLAPAFDRRVPYVANGQSRVAACIPLEIDEEVVGCIAIYRLLPHKPSFEPIDLELFDLLKTHAAAALLATSRETHEAAGMPGANHGAQ